MKKIILLLITALMLSGCVSTPPNPTPSPSLVATAIPGASPSPSIEASANTDPSVGKINVTIDSISCVYNGSEYSGLGRQTTTSTSGIASGPVDSYLEASDAYLTSMDCGSWTRSGPLCIRKAGEPELTHWTREVGPTWYNPDDGFAESVVVRCFRCEPGHKEASANCP